MTPPAAITAPVFIRNTSDARLAARADFAAGQFRADERIAPTDRGWREAYRSTWRLLECSAADGLAEQSLAVRASAGNRHAAFFEANRAEIVAAWSSLQSCERLAEWIAAQYGQSISAATISKWVARWGLKSENRYNRHWARATFKALAPTILELRDRYKLEFAEIAARLHIKIHPATVRKYYIRAREAGRMRAKRAGGGKAK